MILRLFLASLLLTTVTAVSATSEAKSQGVLKKNISPRAKLGTSFKFDGTALRGKYQTSLGTRATVENDKMLDDLLKGRTQFKDRLQQAQEQN